MGKAYIALLTTLLALPYTVLNAQQYAAADTAFTDVNSLPEAQVQGYIRPVKHFTAPASAALVNRKTLELNSTSSLVGSLNTVPGISMEERSPGSYRLSIRGSLVRSPYGVRNVKVYYNGFALTDAGGNTYLNALKVGSIANVEVLKGPDGSLFGANSGGVVLLRSDGNDPNEVRLQAFGGSYGYIGNSAQISQQSGKHTWSVTQSYQRADGYRHNTRNHRFFIQAADKWSYNRNSYLEFYAFYSDFAYRTPGGLTLQQYEENPRQSRRATATMPSSAEQKTGTDAGSYFGGIRNKAGITPWLTHTLSVWGNYVDYRNKAISNYETRDEANIGLRTYFSFAKPDNTADLQPLLQLGFEGQRLHSEITNYDNLQGERGDEQAYNRIVSYQYFPFISCGLYWQNRLVLRAALSLNYNGYRFKDDAGIHTDFTPIAMPHVGISYRLYQLLTLRFTVSKGYSTPTTAEIRPVDNKIYDNLQPEKGWNTEGGIRLRLLKGALQLDASVFRYLLKEGIISQVSAEGNTYFVNSGRIRQLGVEYSHSWMLKKWQNSSFLRMVRWNGSYTYSRFLYDRYEGANADYSGNRVAGVPQHVAVNSLEVRLAQSFYVFAQHTYTSRIPLNDANSEYADSYRLVWLKVGYDRTHRQPFPIEIYVAADNVLNEKYSLGNDTNAFGGRYYNPAPPFNIQVGLVWKLR